MMDQRTKQALEASIVHWEELAAGVVGAVPIAARCALCQMFAYQEDACKGCPVRKRTGESTCDGTPYYAAYRAWNGREAKPNRWQAAAKVELEFLKSLRDGGEEG